VYSTYAVRHAALAIGSNYDNNRKEMFDERFQECMKTVRKVLNVYTLLFDLVHIISIAFDS